MQRVGKQTVPADFADAEFGCGGVSFRFFYKDGRFMMCTDGPDGQLQVFEIACTLCQLGEGFRSTCYLQRIFGRPLKTWRPK